MKLFARASSLFSSALLLGCPSFAAAQSFDSSIEGEAAINGALSPLEEVRALEEKPVCVMHVGPHKTGTTTLQGFLFKGEGVKEGMEKDNYFIPRFLHRGAASHIRLVLCTRMETSRCPFEETKNAYLEDWETQIGSAKRAGSNIVLSAEEFSRPDVNMTVFTDALLPEYKIHVVVYYRRFYDWLHSLFNQLTKHHAQNLTYVEWLDDETLERDLQMYAVEVYKRYLEVPGVFNVSVVNMHEDPENFNTQVKFACDIMDNAPHVCEAAKLHEPFELNQSVDTNWKLFRQRLPLHHPIELKVGDGRWEAIETKFYEMADIPKICLSTEWQNKLLQVSLESEMFLTPESWYRSEEGLENLKSDFEEKITSKFCSMDMDQILKSSEWQDFLTDLQDDEINLER